MCHNLRAHTTNIEQAVWTQRPVVFNGFGAAYRDVLFQKVAPGYVSIFDVPLRQKKDAGHDGRHSSRATRMETATATRSS
jgi:hypothetical protein